MQQTGIASADHRGDDFRVSGPSRSDSPRRRLVIGGGIGLNPDQIEALRRALGSPAKLLVPNPDSNLAAELVADWAGCSIDGVPIVGDESFIELIRRGRLAAVRGAFVVAWFDDRGALHLARDAIGEHTLFYGTNGALAVFSTSFSALLSAGVVERRIDVHALSAYLSYAYVPGGDTLVRGVRELRPGEHVTIRGTEIKSERFWSAPPESDTPVDEPSLTRELRDALERAVRRRLDHAARGGASLSGGLDSSLVVALVRRLFSGELFTYSIFFGDEHRNELQYSSLVSSAFGTTHHVIEIRPESIASELDDTISLLGSPIGDPLTVPNLLLFRAAGLEVDTVFNGEGGDPCFGGPKNLPMLAAELFRSSLYYDGNAQIPTREQSYLLAHKKCFEDLGELLRPDMRTELGERPLECDLEPWFSDPRFKHFISKLMAMNVALKGGHHILPKLYQLSRAAGIRALSPLFDRDLVELSFAIPPQLKLHGSIEKFLLKQSVSDLLPREILERPKSGMLVPVESWFCGPLLGMARERLLDGLCSSELFERRFIERLLESKRRRVVVSRPGAKIWLLVTLEAWLRRVFAGPLESERA